MVAQPDNSEFYRCPLPAEKCVAKIVIERRSLPGIIQEASIDGYTLLLDASDAVSVRLGKPWILKHEGATLEIRPQWLFQAPDGQIQVGVRRLRDLTRLPKVGGWLPGWSSRGSQGDYESTSLLFSSAILLTILALSLPGIAESLGLAESGRLSGLVSRASRWLMGLVTS